MSYRKLLLAIFIVLLLGCAPAEAVTPTPLVAPTTAVTPTPFPLPSPTPIPTGEAISTATFPPPPSPTVTPLPPPTQEATAVSSPTATPFSDLVELQPIPTVEELDYSVIVQFGGTFSTIELAGNVAYIGVGPRVMAVDISNPAQVQFIAQTGLLQGNVQDITIDASWSLLYVALESGGLAVVDPNITAAGLEILNEGPNYSGSTSLDARSVFVHNQVALLLDSGRYDQSSELLRFDITHPSQPVLIDTISLPQYGRISHWQNIIFVLHDSGIDFLDITDPTSQLTSIELSSQLYSPQIQMVDNYAFVTVTGSGSGVRVYDLTDPLNPQPVRVPSIDLFSANETAVNNTLLANSSIFGEFGYCASMVTLIDIQDPTEISQTAQFDPENCVTGMALSQSGYLYLVGRSGLMVYDVTNPVAPTLISRFINPNGFMDVQAAVQKEQYVYTLSGEGRGFQLKTLDLTQPGNPLASEPITLEVNSPLDLHIQDDLLIVSVWMGAFAYYDISNPAQPQLLFNPPLDSRISAELRTAVFFDDFIVTRIFDETLRGGMAVVDVNNPSSTDPIATFETGIHQVMAAERFGDFVAVLSSEGETAVQLFDLSNRANPQLVSTLMLDQPFSRLARHNNTLYAFCEGWNCDEMAQIDYSDPSNPQLLHRWTLPFNINHMESLNETQLIVMTFDDGLWVLDDSEADGLFLSGRINTPSTLFGIKVNPGGSTITVPANNGGFYLVRLGE